MYDYCASKRVMKTNLIVYGAVQTISALLYRHLIKSHEDKNMAQ